MSYRGGTAFQIFYRRTRRQLRVLATKEHNAAKPQPNVGKDYLNHRGAERTESKPSEEIISGFISIQPDAARAGLRSIPSVPWCLCGK
jgi:hypothetical protein